jgi:hypothetical protein
VLDGLLLRPVVGDPGGIGHESEHGEGGDG